MLIKMEKTLEELKIASEESRKEEESLKTEKNKVLKNIKDKGF